MIDGWSTMSFEERQRLWAGQQRYFRQHHGRNERPQVWMIRVNGDRVFTTHGLLEGAMQDTNYQGQFKNRGRANQITPEQDALAEARRDVRKKYDYEGYDEYLGEQNIDRRDAGDIRAMLTNLPGSFCLYKPENNLFDCKGLLKKALAGKVLYSLKRDGLAHWIVVDYYGNIQIYSRRSRPWHKDEGPQELLDGTRNFNAVKPWALRYQHIVAEVKALDLPPGTMLAGEMLWFNPKTGRESFPQVSSFSKSLQDQSLADQAALGRPHFYWWDLPFLEGVDLVSTEKVISRYARIHSLARAPVQYILPVQYMKFPNPDAALEYAVAHNLEGWVVIDPEGVYGDRAWNLKGKPDRPGQFCAKLKPKAEDDFVCLWDPDHGVGEWGTGKHERGKLVTLPNGAMVTHGGVGAVLLHQYNSAGDLIPICKCSSGMDYETQACMGQKSFPFVAEVQYTERTYQSEGDKTNALRHPVFLRRRDDKLPAECINERL